MQWLPFGERELREAILGRKGGEAKAPWDAALEDRSWKKKKRIGGQWRIGVYQGHEGRVGAA
eukprot:15435205-Alexandrium_andersonii.AAC.1